MSFKKEWSARKNTFIEAPTAHLYKQDCYTEILLALLLRPGRDFLEVYILNMLSVITDPFFMSIIGGTSILLNGSIP